MWPNPDAIWDTNADMVTFTEKALNGKICFLCNEVSQHALLVAWKWSYK